MRPKTISPHNNWLLFNKETPWPWARLRFLKENKLSGWEHIASKWEYEPGYIILKNDRNEPVVRFLINPESGYIAEGHAIDAYPLDKHHSFTLKFIGKKEAAATQRDFPKISLSELKSAIKQKFDCTFDISRSKLVSTNRSTSISFQNGSLLYPPGNHFYNATPRFESAPWFCYVLHDCDLISGTVVFDQESRAIYETAFQAELRTRDQDHSICEADEDRSVYSTDYKVDVFVPGVSILINTLTCNYGHWHTQSLPNFKIIDMLRQLGMENIDTVNLVIVNGFQAHEPFRQQSLEVLGIQSHRVLDPRALVNGKKLNYKFETLFVPSTHRVQEGEVWNTDAVEYIRKSILKLKKEFVDGPKRIYLTRENVCGRRCITNEDLLIDRLKSSGFHIFDSRGLNYQEQLQLFFNCDVIIGAHGGAMSNMLAAKAGTKIIELLHSGQLTSWYRNLAFICDHEYHAICGVPSDPIGKANWDSKFEIDIDLVVQKSTSFSIL